MKDYFLIPLILILWVSVIGNSQALKYTFMKSKTMITDTGEFYHAQATEQCKKPVMPGDYFFRGKKHESLFIKISESSVSKEEIDQYLNKKVLVTFKIKTGAWRESNQNPNANQTYMVLHSIEELPN